MLSYLNFFSYYVVDIPTCCFTVIGIDSDSVLYIILLYEYTEIGIDSRADAVD